MSVMSMPTGSPLEAALPQLVDDLAGHLSGTPVWSGIAPRML